MGLDSYSIDTTVMKLEILTFLLFVSAYAKRLDCMGADKKHCKAEYSAGFQLRQREAINLGYKFEITRVDADIHWICPRGYKSCKAGDEYHFRARLCANKISLSNGQRLGKFVAFYRCKDHGVSERIGKFKPDVNKLCG